MNDTDPMVILTNFGLTYLKNQWGENVNKNGKKNEDKVKPKPDETVTQVKHADVQRFDNRLINLLLPYYTSPEK